MRKLVLLVGVLLLSPMYGATAQNLQLPSLGDVLQDVLTPNRNSDRRNYDDRDRRDDPRAYNEWRAEQERREDYRDRRDDERRAYERRDERDGSPSWSRGRDDENRGRGRGNNAGRGNDGNPGRGNGR
ncbi:hypothetical protein [Falsiroseomonas sp. E2-1-a4]|uniref:hypothetical protein n=1 Tax=Falsiroseomonas sp. E2-1-a4 TaxID=3239299 RepID=UPI003F3326FE